MRAAVSEPRRGGASRTTELGRGTNAGRLPAVTLLEEGDLPVEEVAELALREGQATSPLFRVHRWFARRLGSQFRAILAGLSLGEGRAASFWDRYLSHIPLGGLVVLDPFVGGGTGLVESQRCDASVIGFDIDPVATFITRFELAASASDPLAPELTAVCDAVRPTISQFHRTTNERGESRDVLHHFWVEVGPCPGCREEIEVHPHYRLAYDKAKKLQWAFCRACHEVQALSIERKVLQCACGTRTRIDEGPLAAGKVTCPRCSARQDLVSMTGIVARGARWRLFAQEYLEPKGSTFDRVFKKASRADSELFTAAAHDLRSLEAKGCPHLPAREIPSTGRWDQRPLIHGFLRYRELFNDRQLLHLARLAEAVAGVPDEGAKRILSLAFSEHLATNCMYASYAFGYRRISPLFSIHSYRHIMRPVELNPWLEGIGRGTFPNALRKVKGAIAFARGPSDLVPQGGRQSSARTEAVGPGEVSRSAEDVLNGTSRAAIITRSSANMAEVADRSVDLILTDPPYFDNISYSELSDFYLAWHQCLGIAEPPYDDRNRSAPLKENLAVTTRSKEGMEEYRRELTRIFEECARVLKRTGVCVLTYHHRSERAWWALGEAIARSGLRCTGVVPLRGEGQGGLHSYEGTIKWDAVLVCRPGRSGSGMKGGTLVVSPEDVAASDAIATAWAERLGRRPKLGFRAADRENLLRALIVARSRLRIRAAGCLPLDKALAQTSGMS